MRTNLLHSARARFAATASVVFALVALGGVTAAPAFAGPSALRVSDAATGQLWPFGDSFYLTNVDSGATEVITTDGATGYYTHYIADGSYTLASLDTAHVPSAVSIVDGITYQTIAIDTYKVSGTIPTVAGSGLTAAAVEYFNGTSWGPVGATVDPTTVTAADGSFTFRAPQGPANYRLRLTPNASTGYTETLVPFSITGSSPAVTQLGAVSLDISRSIGGTVYAADGTTPIVGATVHASQGGTDVATATSGADGSYRIALPSSDATYTVHVTATGFADQEWNAVTPGSETVAVNATAGYERTGIDFALAGVPVTVSGRVLNYYSLDEDPVIQLYSGGATPALIGESAMGATGEYSFDGVTAGDYFVKVVPAEVDEYLTTLLGAANVQEWPKSSAAEVAFATAHAFTVDPTVPSTATDHDLILQEASILSGRLTYANDPIAGCVLVKNISDAAIDICAEANDAGQWFARVPVGGTYKLEAQPAGFRYGSQWWSGASSESTATEVGPVARGVFGSYTFFVPEVPATLNVSAVDDSSADPITVYLYIHNGSDWRPLGQATTDPANDVTDVSFADLDDADYRVRFQRADGTWLAATSVTSGVYPDAAAGVVPACFVDFPDLTDGPASTIAAGFTATSANQGCGPQVYTYGEVTGSVVSSDGFGPVDIADHVVTLENNGTTRSNTTGADGSFTFSYVPNDVYTIEVSSQTHTLGEHEYTYSATGLELGNGDVDLGTLIATRLGNAYGQISNWNSATMSGTATVYTEGDCGCWTPNSVSVNIAADGSFEAPGIDVDGEYGVLVEFASGYAPVFLGGGYPAPTDPFTGTAEQDYSFGSVAVDLVELVTISGRVMFGDHPVEGAGVIALPDGYEFSTAFFAQTDADGYYEIEVAPNADYEVLAVDGSYEVQIQTYDGHNYPNSWDGPLDFDPVEVGTSDVAGINFSLVAIDEVGFEVETYTANYDDNLTDVDVHLYQMLNGTWQQIATFTSDEYAEAYYEALGDGDYRLGFSKDGTGLAMDYVYSELYYPYADDQITDVDFGTAQCYYDLPDVKHGTYVEVEVALVTAPVGSECGVAAPVIVPTPPTTGKPRNPAQTVIGDFPQSEGPAPAPTATPTPDPAPSESAPAEPDDAAGSDDVTTASAPDLTWVFVVAGILVLLVLAGGAVYLVRRRP